MATQNRFRLTENGARNIPLTPLPGFKEQLNGFQRDRGNSLTDLQDASPGANAKMRTALSFRVDLLLADSAISTKR